MKNYILMLGVAGVVLGSYCAYAGNSATMTVTATIAHDVSLSVTQDIDLGTITINPAYTEDITRWGYSDSGAISYTNKGAIVSAPNATVGTFTANIANPSACNGTSNACGGLSLTGNYGSANGFTNDFICFYQIKYDNYSFKLYPYACVMDNVSSISTDSYEGTLTISYTAS
ncbi:MAG: hypothetical protein IJ689_05510 [Alphaproteobacteria bacterium]|nr:hypothetical protein [Alphaproteobacteria bacterium]